MAGHRDWISAAAVTPDGKRALSASANQTLKLWDLNSGAELRTLVAHTGSVNAVAITPDGRRAISASGDHTLKLRDFLSGQVLATFNGNSGITANAVWRDNRTFVAGETSGRIHFLVVVEPGPDGPR